MKGSCLLVFPSLAFGAAVGLPYASGSISPTEDIFLDVPDAENARKNLRFITSKPHVAGTKGDYIMAGFVAKLFKEAGLTNVTMFDLEVLLNYPAAPPQVSLLESDGRTVLYNATLSENVEEFDDTSDTNWRNHTFHGYSPSGTVTAPLVYANYGRPEDFAALEAAGINVSEKIVIVRYGRCFRGLKVMNAQDRGALGVIIYSDPAEDGFGQGEVYPNGPWRPASGVQRGSVQFNSKCAGDPMRADSRYEANAVQKRCGVGSYKDLIPSIPSVPMSYGDALPLLQQLGGKSASEVGGDDFIGGLNITYTVGPTETTVVRLVVENADTIGRIPNVVAHIPGSFGPEMDMPVLLGNHRDAWVYGAADPNSGTASLIEVARGLGRLLRIGWSPKRSIYLLSWSGEEYGLLGSTGWAELNARHLKKACAYLNVDTVVSGDLLSSGATPSLATVWNGVLDDLNVSSKHRVPFRNSPRGDLIDSNANWIMNHPKQKILGSGSDYTVFLDHYGIASLDFSFGKKTTYGTYHSIYDSFAWMDSYGGRDGQVGSAFQLMAFASKIWGLLALRIADSYILPFDQSVQGEALMHYVDSIRDPESFGLDLTSLDAAVSRYKGAAARLSSFCTTQHNSTFALVICNKKLGLVERRFVYRPGLPDRQWFRHVLQAPGMYLGYAAESFPGVRYAVEMGNHTLAQLQVGVIADRIDAAAYFLDVNDTQQSPK